MYDFSGTSTNNKLNNHYISWSSEEDQLLAKLVESSMDKSKQDSAEKYKENLPDNSNNKSLVKNRISSINWIKISEKFINKNPKQCQQRWQNILDPNRIKGSWTQEEDQKLIESIAKFGPHKWSVISEFLPGRLGKQCRERWFNHLNPQVRKTEWTQEEEWVLFILHKKYGNSWSKLSSCIPGRTDNTIKNHWNSTMRKSVVAINNKYQDLIKGKSKKEVEQIEQNILAECRKINQENYEKFVNSNGLKDNKLNIANEGNNNEKGNSLNKNSVTKVFRGDFENITSSLIQSSGNKKTRNTSIDYKRHKKSKKKTRKSKTKNNKIIIEEEVKKPEKFNLFDSTYNKKRSTSFNNPNYSMNKNLNPNLSSTKSINFNLNSGQRIQNFNTVFNPLYPQNESNYLNYYNYNYSNTKSPFFQQEKDKELPLFHDPSLFPFNIGPYPGFNQISGFKGSQKSSSGTDSSLKNQENYVLFTKAKYPLVYDSSAQQKFIKILDPQQSVNNRFNFAESNSVSKGSKNSNKTFSVSKSGSADFVGGKNSPDRQFINPNTATDLNREFFSNINVADEKNNDELN